MKFLPLLSVFAIPFLTAFAAPSPDPWNSDGQGLSGLVAYKVKRSWDDEPLLYVQRRGLRFGKSKQDDLTAVNAKDAAKVKGE